MEPDLARAPGAVHMNDDQLVVSRQAETRSPMSDDSGE